MLVRQPLPNEVGRSHAWACRGLNLFYATGHRQRCLRLAGHTHRGQRTQLITTLVTCRGFVKPQDMTTSFIYMSVLGNKGAFSVPLPPF
jgi:hypothetical protein